MEVRLFATFREGRGKTVHVDWYEGMDGFALFSTLKIDPKEPSIFVINGVISTLDTKLKPEDIVALFPQIAGG